MTSELAAQLDEAKERGELLASSHENIRALLQTAVNPLYEVSVAELAGAGAWSELNDRFFTRLAFGTGGLRGRTISARVTSAERGQAAEGERPDHPCVGTNALNFYNITRATLGLCRYLKAAHEREGRPGRPSLAVARDTRHFGSEFADQVAKVATETGCDVFRFVAPRSTPELSFSVRHLGAGAGIVLTASHNPPPDNGYKVYWNDGAQVVEPHAGGIIAEVNAIAGESYDAVPESERGTVTDLGADMDEAYLARLESLLLDPELVKSQRDSLRIVFTNLHGTGGAISPQLLRRLGFHCDTVPEQDVEDGWFPTVKSPNPENAEALALGIAQAERDGADIVIATDPDADRMGVAVRDGAGALRLITGNQIGSLLAWYRIRTLIRQGILTDANRDHSVLVKTFVTTELQGAIAAKHRIPCVNTLTGFKYIGEKLGKYERQIPAALRADYRKLSDAETRDLRLEHSRFFIFGGEESYGYLGADFLRDKDANGAVAMFAELAAFAKAEGTTIPGLLDRLYLEYGYHREGQHSETLKGADGARQIQALAGDYGANPPAEVDGVAVTRVRDFSKQEIHDEEGDLIPKEKMLFVDLADGRAFAVRPSGTEPKIKFYFYQRPKPGTDPAIAPGDLPAAKAAGDAAYEALLAAVIADMRSRLERLS
jgi:phosphoglucomutase